LPDGYFAEPKVQFGIPIDVAAVEERDAATNLGGPGGPATVGWMAPAPSQTIALPVIADVVEIQVFDGEGGPTLAGAIELVSPANKDRPEHRDAFLNKCAAYLQHGLGLVMVDVVTGRRANLHWELLDRLGVESILPKGVELDAAAYRPVERGGQPRLDIWQEGLAIGQPMPSLPLWLRGALCLEVDLEGTYGRTCREQRILVGA
jgi:hypothetical protein